MEIRLHGRGGQGGVTCAKILAAVYARLGKSVQTFGDYAGERSGAPVRAYTRVSDEPITNRNKVYDPDHLLVLDPTLLGTQALEGLPPGGMLLLNTTEPLDAFAELEHLRVGVVDATDIARKHGIGTKTVVIVNTTIAGAYAKMMGFDVTVLEQAYTDLGFLSNFPAAKEAYDAVRVRESNGAQAQESGAAEGAPRPAVMPLVEHTQGPVPPLKTGSWRQQEPRYVQGLAPCNAWCPAGNDVIGFVQAVVRDGEEAAAKVLGATTPLAAVCGRVCPAPCMEGCNRAEYDGAVNIRGLERWISDHTSVAVREKATPKAARWIAVVGSGPAGLSAAYVLAQKGHTVTLFEGEEQLGGVLRTGIPNFRLPRDVLDREIADVLALGVEARTGEFLDAAMLSELVDSFDGVVMATGLQKLRSLDAPGSDLEGVEQGIRYLHRLNTQGEAPLSGRVVVLGGGNTAMDCARSALRAGAEEVFVAYRRTRKEMPAIREEIDEALEEGVIVTLQRQPVAFHGNGRVQAVEVAEVEMGAPDDSGRRRPVVTDRTHRMECDAVLLALGQSADLSLLPKGWDLREGRLWRGDDALNCFAAGDVATGDGTVTHAIGDGRRAAERLLAALGEDVTVFTRPPKEDAVPATDVRFDHFATAPPAPDRHVPPLERVAGFDLANLGIESPLEAHRCFSCGECTQCDTCLVYCPEGIVRRKTGGYEVDYTYCKGCGVCVTECPRKAMEMVSL